MTRPLQEGKMFYKNGWYEPLAGYDFSDFPKNAMSVATFGTKTYLVPLVTEWQVLYYRKDLFKKAGIKVPDHLRRARSRGKEAQRSRDGVAGFASRGKGAAAVTQMSSYVYNYGGLYLDKGKAVFNSKPALDAIRFYGKMLGNYGPQGVDVHVLGEHHAALPGRQGRHVDRRLGLLRPDRRSGQDRRSPRRIVGIANFPAGPKENTPSSSSPGAWPSPSSPRTRTLAMKFLDLGDQQGPGQARHARQHHDGPHLGLGRQGGPREGQSRPRRHPRLRRQERLSPTTGPT